nr:PhnD/SsuA/transferrin family substrate-binding protein [uncultured Oribacterium sp.]
MEKIKLGAVIYAPKVTVIWGIIQDFFASEHCPIEPVFYKDYKSQVDGLMKGEIDIAWNSPLAWLDAFLRSKGECLDGSMRDTDQNRKSYLVVRKDKGFKDILDLKGKTIGLGLNGDHVGGELDAAKAMLSGEVDGRWMLDLNYKAWIADGTLDEARVQILSETAYFDHCIFTGRPDFSKEQFAHFTEVLHKMDYKNPAHKEMMDMEGLKAWVPGRTENFEQIKKANEYLHFFSKEQV